MFLLPTRNLMAIYTWLASVGSIIWSLICNEEYLKSIYHNIQHHDQPISAPLLMSPKFSLFPSSQSEAESPPKIFVLSEIFESNKSIMMLVAGNLLMQIMVVFLFSATSGSPNNTTSHIISGIIFLLPVLSTLVPGISTNIVSYMPTISMVAAIFYLFYNLARNVPKIARVIYSDIQWARSVVRHYGLYTLIENQWSRLHVPQVSDILWNI